MVGVASNSLSDEMSSKKNPMIKFMLKTRENHAHNQEHDYSHVFRKKTRFELFRLSAIAMAIEFAYAAETSFVSPILLKIGINHEHMSMAWGLSPLIGFFVAPLLGSISDRCKLKWGRRRPIISLLSLGILMGLILVPYGKDIGTFLGDQGFNNTNMALVSNYTNDLTQGSVAALTSAAHIETGPTASDYKFAVILTIVGMVLLDFDADTCQTPARTYLLDMCIPEDQPKGLTMFSLFAGIGGTIGYGIGGIDWETTQIGSFLGGNVPTVFTIVTIIFVICYIITITTFREIPLELIEKDVLLSPLSEKAIKRELNKKNNAVYYIKETDLLQQEMLEHSKEQDSTTDSESYQNGYSPVTLALPDNTDANNKAVQLEADVDDEPPASLSQYLKSIFIMPYSMRILAFTNLLCWMGHVTYCLYFTDFVGEAVFGGNPKAPFGTDTLLRYEEGVRFGCLGMSIYALSCSVYSLSVTKLMKVFGIKVVYISGMVYYAIGMLVLGLWPTKWGVLVFSTSAGILYGTLFTIPYILVASYHAKNCFRVKNGETVPLKQPRGLGTDVSIISSMVFIAQIIVSLSVGPLVEWLQSTSAVLYASAVFSAASALAALFVLYV